MKRSKFMVALSAVLLICLMTPALAERVRMSPKGGSLYLRAGASRDTKAVGGVHDGDYITVLEYGDIWSKVKTKSGRVGYIKNLYIDDGDTTYAAGTDYLSPYTAYTTAGVNLRAGASTSTSVIRTLSSGTKVSVRGKNGRFYLVQTKDGTQGYVSGSYLSKTKGSSSSSGGSSSGATKTVTASYVNVREGGGMSYDVVDVLPRGTKVTVLKKGNYWTRIRCGSTVGWIKNDYLR